MTHPEPTPESVAGTLAELRDFVDRETRQGSLSRSIGGAIISRIERIAAIPQADRGDGRDIDWWQRELSLRNGSDRGMAEFVVAALDAIVVSEEAMFAAMLDDELRRVEEGLSTPESIHRARETYANSIRTLEEDSRRADEMEDGLE